MTTTTINRPIYTKTKTVTFSRKKLTNNILTNAKVLNLHQGAAKLFAEKTANAVAKWAENRPVLTQQDLDKKVTTELRKYNKDLAYIYKMKGKII